MPKIKLTDEQKKIAKDLERRLEAERHREKQLANQFLEYTEMINDGRISEPTILYNIGDNVQLGNLHDTVITGIFHNGKVYSVDTTYIDNNYGNPISHREHRYAPWMDLYPIQSNKNEFIDFVKRDKEIAGRMNTTNINIDSLLHTYYYSKLNIDVEFQRGLVWTLEQKELLLHSIYFNCPIGAFVLNRRSFSDPNFCYDVLDGKQRLMAIVGFYEGRFKYDGKFYRELCFDDRHHFDDYPISVINTQELTELQKMKVFLRYNTTGKPIAQEHLEKVQKMIENTKENKHA